MDPRSFLKGSDRVTTRPLSSQLIPSQRQQSCCGEVELDQLEKLISWEKKTREVSST